MTMKGISTVAEVLTLAGAGAAISYGAWLAYPPAGPVAVGTIMIAGLLLNARRT